MYSDIVFIYAIILVVISLRVLIKKESERTLEDIRQWEKQAIILTLLFVLILTSLFAFGFGYD